MPSSLIILPWSKDVIQALGSHFHLPIQVLKEEKVKKGLMINSNQVTHPGGAYPGSTREWTTGSIAYFATVGY